MRYRFDHKAKKLPCPSCGKAKVFRTYLDTSTGMAMDPSMGMCDRQNSCGYHYKPSQFFRDGGQRPERVDRPLLPPPPPIDTSWRCSRDWVECTYRSHAKNRFAHWLAQSIGRAAARAVFDTYRIGTLPLIGGYEEFEGACVWWQIDEKGEYRSGKIVQYGPDGKRDHDLGAMWMHTIMTGESMSDIGCESILFGRHLLPMYPRSPIALVEAEKSAAICSAFYGSHLWLATGGSQNFNVSRCMSLVGSDLHVFPDKGMFEDVKDSKENIHTGWRSRGNLIEVMCERLVMPRLLEDMDDVPMGADIADLLLPINRLENIRIFEPRPEPVVQEELPATTPPTMAPILQRMIDNNPAILTLGKELDLDFDNPILTPRT